jgi:hypothetical protein
MLAAITEGVKLIQSLQEHRSVTAAGAGSAFEQPLMPALVHVDAAWENFASHLPRGRVSAGVATEFRYPISDIWHRSDDLHLSHQDHLPAFDIPACIHPIDIDPAR